MASKALDDVMVELWLGESERLSVWILETSMAIVGGNPH